MVAGMAGSGGGAHLDDGDEDIPPPDPKDCLTENESSSSDASTDESSSGEEDEEQVDEEERTTGASSKPENTTVDELPTTHGNHKGILTGVNHKLGCEKCKAKQNPDYELVTPKRMSRGRLQLVVEDEGTYECSVTGLVFEVSQGVQIKYCLLSWSKFGAYLKDEWKFAGPIFDVDCDPAILKSIQFPHSLCLADQDDDMVFSVLHMKNSKPVIEPSVEHSGSHIKWSVSSLSPVGPIVQTNRQVGHHGVVLVFKEVDQQASYSFRVYLAPNNDSDIKDIMKEVRSSKKKYMKMEKPPTCQRLLEESKKYRLTSDPEGDITPVNFQFTLHVVKLKGYFEAFFEQPPPFKLSLIEVESDQVVWSATIREGDCVDNGSEKTKRRIERKRNSTSTSEEEANGKRSRWDDESDGIRTDKCPKVTNEQLMEVAKCMGKEWKQVAISYLGLDLKELEKIEVGDEELTMQKFRMLDLWRQRRSKGDAGVAELYTCLNKDDVPNEVRDALEDMMNGDSSK
ncbi:uncharacterized protein LOC114769776 isoform X2 [Denticeps clupeoides]|uniref:uncharacterized protein LOC114769776 isoform X2 n=1 Tax=Denticeps clupeoides TaxID=299321 RepID=UPI0010A5183F|nr:uncharacterized protein LOC114769776 isoform X2 [Denticeps clupeoides]